MGEKSRSIPGLVRIKGNDRDEVEKARKHLLELFEDPHYVAAYIRLRKARKTPSMPRGSIPVDPGELARRIIDRDTEKPKRGGGRPEKMLMPDREFYRKLFEVLDSKTISVAKAARMFVRSQIPNASEEVVRNNAKEVAQYLRNARKKLGKNSPDSA